MKNGKKKSERLIAGLFKQVPLLILDVMTMLLTILIIFSLYAYAKTPSVENLQEKRTYKTSIIYDRTGEHVLYEIHGEENRKTVSHDEISNNIRIATIAAEDDGFYEHKGIDWISTIRALKNDIKNKDISQGGSTITQQLARNIFLTREKTIKRKFLESILAIKIEKRYSKDQIMDMYLNEVPYGSNAYGIQAATETFFGKNASDLTLDEAALLASMTKATSFYSPYGENSRELKNRQKQILQRIGDLGLSDPESVKTASETDTLEKIIPLRKKIKAPHFVFHVKEQLENEFGANKLEKGGLRIYTTLDYDMQQKAEKIIEEKSLYNQTKYGASNASLVAINPKNGQILTMVGSRNYFDEKIDGNVNVATRPRQPGSSFKPFAYAKAFEEGYDPDSLILDAKTNFGPDGSGRDYIPRNYDGKSHGIVSIRQALAMSLNIPAIKILRLVGIDNVIELAHRMGITTLNEKNRYGLSLVIGGGEVKLLDETAGFSVFANDGKKNPPVSILKITDSAGKIIKSEPIPPNTPVLNSQTARKINSILSDNESRIPIFGSRNLLHIPGKTVAAKTGTTQEWRDAWTVGYTPSIAVGVWAGNNDNRPMATNADGSFVAAPIWNAFMSQALLSLPNENFIAYEKQKDYPKFAESIKYKIVYYNKKSGKKISEEKFRKSNPKKVEARMEASLDSDKKSFLVDDSLLEELKIPF